jgi:hypothetical protein
MRLQNDITFRTPNLGSEAMCDRHRTSVHIFPPAPSIALKSGVLSQSRQCSVKQYSGKVALTYTDRNLTCVACRPSTRIFGGCRACNYGSVDSVLRHYHCQGIGSMQLSDCEVMESWNQGAGPCDHRDCFVMSVAIGREQRLSNGNQTLAQPYAQIRWRWG